MLIHFSFSCLREGCTRCFRSCDAYCMYLAILHFYFPAQLVGGFTLSDFRALSANQFSCKKKSLRVCALGENWTREIDFSRHEDNLPSHRGRRLPFCFTILVVLPPNYYFTESFWSLSCDHGLGFWNNNVRKILMYVYRECQIWSIS